jgi:hypothetical protein
LKVLLRRTSYAPEPIVALKILPAPAVDDRRLPVEVDRIVARCLRKDPKRRFQHMDDVRVALQEVKDELATGQLTTPPAAPLRRVAGGEPIHLT